MQLASLFEKMQVQGPLPGIALLQISQMHPVFGQEFQFPVHRFFQESLFYVGGKKEGHVECEVGSLLDEEASFDKGMKLFLSLCRMMMIRLVLESMTFSGSLECFLVKFG